MFVIFLIFAILLYISMIVLTGIMTDMSKLKYDFYILPITLLWLITWLIRGIKHLRHVADEINTSPIEMAIEDAKKNK